MHYAHFPFYLFVFLVNQQECLALPLCWKTTPTVGHTGGGRYLHVDFPLLAPQGPHMQGIWSHVQDSHQAQLALWGISFAMLQGPATRGDRVIRQVTACLDAPQGEDDSEQEESCRAPRATSLHIPVGRSLGAWL